MKTKPPKISIITPVYNRKKLIGETIDSILDQNYPNLEYIVVNDGSTDTSLEVIRKYGNKLKIINQENQGETAAVNRGLKMATGEIVGIVNSDDLLNPGSLLKVINFFNRYPNILVAYPNWQVINENGTLVEKVNVREHDYRYMFSKYSCYVGPGAFFKRSVIKIIGGRNSRFKYVGDFEFWLKLGLYGEFRKIPHNLASFRVHSSSQSQYAKGKEMAEEHKKLIDEILSFQNFPGELKKNAKEAYSSAYYHAASSVLDLDLKAKYYLMSFFQSPIIFLEKVKYEIIKRKKRANIY